MSLVRLLCLLALVIPAGVGCRACQSCYDYSPPVLDGTCGCQQGCGSGRAGSVLSGGTSAISYSAQ